MKPTMARMRTRPLLVAAVLAGCPAADGDPTIPAVSPWPMDSGGGAGTAAESSADDDEGDTSIATGTTTADDTAEGSTTADEGSGSSGSEVTGDEGGEIVPCSLEDLDPAMDPSTVIDYGDGVGQIPTEIGEALLRHCGCHYTDDIQIVGLTDYNSDKVPLSVWDDFHVPFDGVFPMNFEGTVWEATEVRVTFHEPLPMPPAECDLDGHGKIISDEDFVLFAQWFDAGAPDGANWPP